MNLIQQIEAEDIAQVQRTKTIPEFRPGDTLRVGVQRRRRRAHPRPELRRRVHRPLEHAASAATSPCARCRFGEGVERVFPLYSPNVEIDRRWSAAASCAAPSSIICAAAPANAPESPSAGTLDRRARRAERRLTAETTKFHQDRRRPAPADGDRPFCLSD